MGGEEKGPSWLYDHRREGCFIISESAGPKALRTHHTPMISRRASRLDIDRAAMAHYPGSAPMGPESRARTGRGFYWNTRDTSTMRRLK